MTWPTRRTHVHQRCNRTIELNVLGQKHPESLHVCPDACRIVEKMLSANQAIGAFSRCPQFEFEEVMFILTLLGALVKKHHERNYPPVDLWISES